MTETKSITTLQEFRGTIDKMGDQFLAALPAHISVEKYKRTVVTAVTMNPDLLSADRRTLLASCMKAASDGLLLDGRDAALVKFGQDVQYIPMIGGILKRMRQSGDIKSVTVEVVHEHDTFARWIDESGDHLKHAPNYDGDRGAMKLAYSLIVTKDGGVYIEVMDKAAIEKVRSISKTGKSPNGPWTNWEPEMWRKTVLRRGAKRAPMSTDVMELLERDDNLIDLSRPTTTVTQLGSRPSRPTSLEAVVHGNAARDTALSEDASPVASDEPQTPYGDDGVID